MEWRQARPKTYRALFIETVPIMNHKLTYTVIPISSNRWQLRARTDLPTEKLRHIAERNCENIDTNFINKRKWQWVYADCDQKFTALFLLSFNDKTIYGEIVYHTFRFENEFKVIKNNIIRSILNKFKFSI